MRWFRWLSLWVKPSEPNPLDAYETRPLRDRLAVFIGFRGKF